jgi:hypothetical protein
MYVLPCHEPATFHEKSNNDTHKLYSFISCIFCFQLVSITYEFLIHISFYNIILKLFLAPLFLAEFRSCYIYICFLSCWWLFSRHALNHVQVICMSRLTLTVLELLCSRCSRVSEPWTPTIKPSSRRSWRWTVLLGCPLARPNTTSNKPSSCCSWRLTALLGSPLQIDAMKSRTREARGGSGTSSRDRPAAAPWGTTCCQRWESWLEGHQLMAPSQWHDDPRPVVKVVDDDDHDILLVILYMV